MAPHSRLLLSKDREEIILKFRELIEKAQLACDEFSQSKDGTISGDLYFQVRASALNLLARLTSEDSFYVRELRDMPKINPFVMRGILSAALVDYMQGFLADNKLLVSAEVFADFLSQAEVLLENDYKDAAAVVVRSVLEDGLRRLCEASKLETDRSDGVFKLAEKLARANVLTKIEFKEIEAKKEVGNDAAHGHFDAYTKADVLAFHEFVQRFLANHLR
ncbi:MAG: DUF4145 domain-containing protein [Bacteroidota bacterium]|nr:DUF4145 domain-containing protein [Bacteroidota bacterium]